MSKNARREKKGIKTRHKKDRAMPLNKELEDMQRSFEHFMLTGRKGDSNSSTTTLSPHQHRISQTNSVRKAKPTLGKKKLTVLKIAQPVLTSIGGFHKVFVNEWLSVDDHLYLVVESIFNLRERVWIASRQKCWWTNNAPCPSTNSWKNEGLRGVSQTLLQSGDVNLALSHSLLAHERMLSALRQGLSQMAEAQKTLGRRLEDIFEHYDSFEMNGAGHTLDSDEEGTKHQERTEQSVGQKVDECLELYRAAASELYRKQILGQAILDSDHDLLLYHDKHHKPSYMESPKEAARSALVVWARAHRQSSLYRSKYLIASIAEKVDGM